MVGGALGLILIAVLHRDGRRGFVRTAGVTALLCSPQS